jgi:exosome complex component RRP42
MEASTVTIEALRRMFEQGKRFDSRGLLDLRTLSVEIGISNTAEGSARVRLGKTEVIAGVKLAPGTPYPDSPDKGNLVVSGDLLPLASPRFESGPPGFGAIELPRLLDRAIRESHIIDLGKLVITPGEKVWTVYIDVYPINDDGNLVDAAMIACLVALRNTRVPALDENSLVDYDKPSISKLPVNAETLPLCFSFFKLGNTIVYDPTREEEEAMEVRITLGISRWNGQYMINSCQKSGVASLKRKEIEHIVSLLPAKYEELIERLKKFL